MTRQPVSNRWTGSSRPGPELLDGDLPVIREFMLAKRDWASLAHEVIGKNDLVDLLEGVCAEVAGEAGVDADFFLHFTDDRIFRLFPGFQESRHQPVPVFRPPMALYQHYSAVTLDDAGHDGCRITPVDEITLLAGARFAIQAS